MFLRLSRAHGTIAAAAAVTAGRAAGEATARAVHYDRASERAVRKREIVAAASFAYLKQ